jgi:hypothetical protein
VNISRSAKVWLFVACIVAAFSAVLTPAWVIQPFRPQSDRWLAFSLVLRRLSPWITIVLLAVAAFLAGNLWRGARRWSRAFLGFGFAFCALLTWLARQNHFEWMFHPLPHPAYANIADATFVEDQDLVMAVARNGEAAAYPIRQLAYHHIVHDAVGGVPIVVTY